MNPELLTTLAIAIFNYTLIALALGAIVVLGVKRQLGEHALRLGPTRDLGLDPVLHVINALGVLAYGIGLLFITADSPAPLLFAFAALPLLLMTLLVVQALRSHAGLRKIGLLPRHPGRDVKWGVVGGVLGFGLAGSAGLVVGLISAALGDPVQPIAHEKLVELKDAFTPQLLLELVLTAVVLAPLIEELVFRGLLQTSLVRLMRGRRWPALLLAAGFFAVIHWAVLVSWHGIVPLFVLGLVFGYLYERTGSLAPPILAHALFNAMNIAQALALPQ
ncbi:MAG: lysostaphin resistance A-like protein [Phycisphaeraceae bacterium]